MHDEVAENKVNFFKSIINNSFDIISVISTDWSIIFESNATTRILGYESGKRNGKNIFDFIHKDDKDYVLKKFEELTVAPSVSINIEFRYRHENSDWIWLESSGQNLLSNNEINGLLLNSRDITKNKIEEQKQLEIVELNNAIINSTQDCVKTLDIQGNLLTMNRAGQKLLEINDINRYLNKSWIEFWKDDDYINVRKAFQKAKNGNIGYFEGYCPTVLGKPKWWGIIISPMYNQKGQIHQLLSVSRDITSQKEQKDQLNERIKELKGIQQLSNLVVKYDSIEDILKNLVNVIQRSFLNPHNTSVKITYDEYSFHTPNYNPENITISKVIQVQGNNVCMINIGLTSGTEDDILEEEKTLINIISERLGHIIERIQHKKKYEYLFDTLLEAILEADSEGFIVEANKAAVELCGYTTPAEIKGTHMKELYAHPNTRNEILKKLESEGGAFHNFEFLLKQKNGNRIWTLCNIRLLHNSKGEITGTLGALRDISGYKKIQHRLLESEEKAKALIQAIPDLIFRISHNGVFMDYKAPRDRLYEKNVKYIIGKTIKDIFPKTIADVFDDNIHNTLKGKEIQIFEYEFEVKKKGVRIYEARMVPSGSEEVIAICRDITEQKKAEQALIESEIKYRELNATKDKFFSIISHDLKNPLNAILNFSQLALRSSKRKEYENVQNYCKIINDATKQNIHFLNNLLQWSHLQMGQINFKPEPFILNDVVQDIIKFLNANYKEKGIKLSICIPANLHVFADKFMIETTIRNLVSNAIKYTNQNGWIKLSANKHNEMTLIEIEDNGVGIEKEDIEKLFTVENSYSTPGTNDEKGTGLGLILCKEFIDKHGGKIWAESKINIGTKFNFTISESQ